MRTDPSGRYACLYKRWHLIGLEVGISVASVGLRARADRLRDRVARRRGCDREEGSQGRRDPRRRGRLHGGRQADAGGRRRSRENCLPLGLAHGWKLLQPGGRRAAAQVERRRFRRKFERGAPAPRDGVLRLLENADGRCEGGYGEEAATVTSWTLPQNNEPRGVCARSRRLQRAASSRAPPRSGRSRAPSTGTYRSTHPAWCCEETTRRK